MSNKKSAYQFTTKEQAPLFMCAGKENAGKVPQVDDDGFITKFVNVSSGGTEYTAGDGIIVDNTTHKISLDQNVWLNSKFTGSTKAENVEVTGDTTLCSDGGTVDMTKANTVDLGENAVCAEPTTDDSVANKAYADKKVAQVTAANKVYGTDGDSKQTTFSINVDNAEYTIAYRGTNSTLNVGIPTADTHATPKKYVDDRVAANPTLVGTESDLSGIQIGDTKYKIPSGSSSTHIYLHSISFYAKDGPSTGGYLAFNIFTESNTVLTADTLSTALATYFSGVTSGQVHINASCYKTIESGDIKIGYSAWANSTTLGFSWGDTPMTFEWSYSNKSYLSQVEDTVVQIS